MVIERASIYGRCSSLTAAKWLALLCAILFGSCLLSGCGNSRASTPVAPLPSPDGKLLVVGSQLAKTKPERLG